MSSPASAQGAPVPAVPLSTQVGTAVAFALPLVLGAFGITDTHLPQLIREEVAPFLALISCAVAVAHHATVQEWLRTLAALGTLAGSTAEALPQAAPALGLPSSAAGAAVSSAEAVQAAAAIAGRLIEENRRGVLATAANGRHEAPAPALPAGVVSEESPTVVFPPVTDVAPYPPAVPAAGAVPTQGV